MVRLGFRKDRFRPCAGDLIVYDPILYTVIEAAPDQQRTAPENKDHRDHPEPRPGNILQPPVQADGDTGGGGSMVG
ncbi:hypothetical protein GCM10010434_016650 [Winogradskya humida]